MPTNLKTLRNQWNKVIQMIIFLHTEINFSFVKIICSWISRTFSFSSFSMWIMTQRTQQSYNVGVTFTRITVVLFNEASIFLCDTNTITMVPFLTVVTCSEIQQNPLQSITSHNQLVNLMPLTIIFSTIFHLFVWSTKLIYCIQTLTRYTLCIQLSIV